MSQSKTHSQSLRPLTNKKQLFTQNPIYNKITQYSRYFLQSYPSLTSQLIKTYEAPPNNFLQYREISLHKTTSIYYSQFCVEAKKNIHVWVSFYWRISDRYIPKYRVTFYFVCYAGNCSGYYL